MSELLRILVLYIPCAENIRVYVVLLRKDKGDNSLWESCLFFYKQKMDINL